MDDSDSVQLGGNIELVGFKDIDGSAMVVVKKIVGSYARKFSEMCKNFEKLAVTVKKIHGKDSSKHEVHARVIDNGKAYASDVTDFNMFFALDAALKKVEHELQHP